MINCEYFKEELLTDYLDGETALEKKQIGEDHLKGCHNCRELVQDLRALTEATFRQARVIEPPARVWSNVLESIQPSPSWIDKWRAALALPRMRFALPLLFSVVFLAVLQMNSIQRIDEIQLSTYLQDTISGDLGDLADDEDASLGFGSLIENYFL